MPTLLLGIKMRQIKKGKHIKKNIHQFDNACKKQAE